ncbi:MAG: hypothetical protein Q9181_007664 [Wetmoreana brouardii]
MAKEERLNPSDEQIVTWISAKGPFPKLLAQPLRIQPQLSSFVITSVLNRIHDYYCVYESLLDMLNKRNTEFEALAAGPYTHAQKAFMDSIGSLKNKLAASLKQAFYRFVELEAELAKAGP